MRRAALLLLLVTAGAAGLAGCSSPEDESPFSTPGGAGPPQVSTPSPPEPLPSTTSTEPPPTPDRPTHTRSPRPPDPRWRFFSDDHTRWSSPWFGGQHRVMIPFGCTPAPWYDPDPDCPGGEGFHHGVDVAIPCGVALRAGHPALVLDPRTLGAAYGRNPVLLRIGEQDVVIGHTVRVYVEPGDRLPRGELFARVGDSGAPDGCHLHFEVRPADGGYTSAVDPLPLLALES